MALIDKASLLMVPSTYEAGKLYNVLPSGNRAPDSTDQNSGYDQTRADFDFDRGSNAAASRINSSGLIEKYRENLLLNSNQFDTTWANTSSTETGGQADKDGGTDAWKIERIGTGGYIYQDISKTGVNTISVYAKAGTLNWMRLRVGSAPKNSRYFDLANGVIGSGGGAPVDAKIEAVGNGWYRCSMTTNISVNRVWFYPVPNDGDISGTTGSIFIQSAQLESGLVSTDYLDSTSVTGKAGVLVDLPRINYDANGENGSLLLEPSRQQLLQYSEYFGASDWTKSGVSVTSGFTSPEGLSNAYKLVEDSSNAQHFIYSSNSGGSVGNKITTSFFVKADTRSWCRIIGYDGSSVWFDLENGVLGTQTNAIGSIEPLSNDWYKISSTYTSSHASNEKGYLYLATGNNSTSYQGDGSSGIYIYGAMLETATGGATYPSSYIPNHGESGGVTRAADSCSVTGASDVIGQTEGTIYWEGSIENLANYGTLFALVGLSNSWIYCLTYSVGLTFEVRSNNSVTFSYNPTLTTGTHKIAVAYNASQVVVYIDGVSVFTDYSVIIPATSDLHLGGWSGYTQATKNAQTALFKERLTNEELATLTTL